MKEIAKFAVIKEQKGISMDNRNKTIRQKVSRVMWHDFADGARSVVFPTSRIKVRRSASPSVKRSLGNAFKEVGNNIRAAYEQEISSK